MVDYKSIDQETAQRYFHLYVAENKGEKLRELLAARDDIDLDAPDETMDRPVPAVMRLAVHPDTTDMLQLVLEKGADPDAGKRYPVSPVSHASSKVDKVRLFVAYGADILTPYRNGEDAYTELDIHHDRSAELLTMLLNAGFDANHRFGADDENILFSVNNNDMLPLLRTALEAGADPLKTNEVGSTPLEQAGVRGEEAAEKLLAQYANMPRMKEGKVYTLEELLRPRSNDLRMVDNPYNWSEHMEAALAELAELPDHAALTARGEDGKCAAQVAFEARRGDLVLDCLKAHGQALTSADFYDGQQKPTPLLEAMCACGQATWMFEKEHAGEFSRAMLTDVHARLPEEQQAGIPLFTTLAQHATKSAYTAMGGR